MLAMGQIAYLPNKDTTERKNIANNVRAHLGFAGYSGAAMAREVGLTQSTMSRRTTGAEPFDIDQLVNIARVLDVTVADLITGNLPKDRPGDYSGEISAVVTPIFGRPLSA